MKQRRPEPLWLRLTLIATMIVLFYLYIWPETWQSRPEQCPICRHERIVLRHFGLPTNTVYLPNEVYAWCSLNLKHEHMWLASGPGTTGRGTVHYVSLHPLFSVPHEAQLAYYRGASRTDLDHFAALASSRNPADRQEAVAMIVDGTR